jgi:hypothetical protein
MPIKVWQHGDRPTAAQINEYKTVLDAANTALSPRDAYSPGAPIQLAAQHMTEGVFHLYHCHRYLHFGSNGALQDTDSVYPEVSLSEGANGTGVLDLDSLGWLWYGRAYRVTGVTWCQEDWEP